MTTDIQKLYAEACEQHKEKKYDAALKILDEIKKIDPMFKRAYYLEAWTWELLKKPEKKFSALKKILPLLDFSSPEEKKFAEEILSRVHSVAVEHYKEKNYEEVFKILDDVKRRAPAFRYTYYLEYLTWKLIDNPVKEYYALEKILPLLKFSSTEEIRFASDIFLYIGDVCSSLGLQEESKKFYRLSINMLHDSGAEREVCNLIFRENMIEDASVESFRALYAEYQKTFAGVKPYTRKFYDHEKIRIGFLSSDFCSHPVINWAWALLTQLDKNFFATYFYSNVKKPDDITDQLRAMADGWRDIRDLTDEQAAELIRADEIDILFELNGYTSGYRLRAAAYHPASVQMSGIGYIGSTGLNFFEYFLSDETCVGDENYFVEKLIKLPHSHICYEPTAKIPPADEPPCLKNNFVTFGCFNQFHKITDPMLCAWKKILDAVPASRLLLKNKFLSTEDGKIFMSERLKNLGFDLSRVELRDISTNWLAEYADVDVALDTFPYTGGVTTCEALYMGVPVISLYGQRHGSRFGLSILKNVGLEEFAVDSYDDYIARTVALANDWELLTLLRKNLRGMMENSPLMNSKLYLQEIQAAFRKILDEQKNLWGNANGDDRSKTLR